MNKETERESTARRFGTFGGVFVPNVLTLLGIILFLRIGWVLGNAGFWGAAAIIIFAHLITFATGLSLSAISTNVEVKTGGAYYLISRSLGPEIGGSIGIPLFLSQAISVAFYLIGFSQVVFNLFPFIPIRLTASLVCIFFAYLAYRGADVVLKVQYLIMGILVLSLISFFAGGSSSAVPITYTSNYVEGYNFWTVFAIFFPAAIGISSGVSMSGDLKNPSKSIPAGTISAVIVTFFIYMGVMYWLAVNATPQQLISDEMMMYKVAKVPILIIFGVFASTLSSALACILAAPRTLQALSLDRIVPHFFARMMGSGTEPRVGVIATFIIAEIVILIGNLNIVAMVVTMFFLNTYGMINMVSGLETLIGNPSFRPKFKVPWYLSIMGALACYYVMFLIHVQATIVAIVISYSIFLFLEKRSLNNTWGDVRSGFWFSSARFSILKLAEYKWHPKNWKPNILVFSGNPEYRRYLVDLARWFSKGKGMISLFQMIVGDIEEMAGKDGMKALAYKNLRRFIDENGIEAFPHAEVVKDFEEGVLTTVQAHGAGGLRPNTVLLGWSEKAEGMARLVSLVRKLALLNRSTLVFKPDSSKGFGDKRSIDVWWRGRGTNADMMLLLAYLVSLNSEWRGVKIRLLTIIDDPSGKDKAEENIKSLLEKARLKKDVVVMVREENQNPAEIIHSQSADTDLVILGIGDARFGEELEYARRLDGFIQSLGSCLLVRSVETEELL